MKDLIDAEMAEYSDGAYADHGSARDSLERFASRVKADALEAQAKEIEALKSRLEIDPRHHVDGIYARDATIKLLEDEIEALRTDAERYRWLREFRVIVNKASVALYGEDLDSAIDAARRK